MGFGFISTQPLLMAPAWSEALGSPLVWQVAGAGWRPHRLEGLRVMLRVPGTGRNHQMVEKRASSIQVTPCILGGAERLQTRGEAGAADNGTQCPSALGQRGPKASVQRAVCGLQCGHTVVPLGQRPLGVAAGEELRCKVKELTFKERLRGFLLSPVYDIPLLPQRRMQSSVVPCQAHMR